jgi:hypothetical protein
MARQFNSASSQYLELASAIVAGVPLTISCWFRPASAAASYNLVNIGDAGGANYFNVYANPTGAAATIGATSAGSASGSTGDKTAVTTATYAANRWYHACAVYVSSTSRAAYLDGGGKGTDVNTSLPTAMTQTDVGAYHTGTGVFGAFNGQVAEVAIWNVDLTDVEVAALAGAGGLGGPAPLAGLPLLVRPASLVAYWPLRGEAAPELNLAPTGYSKNIAVVNGPVVVPHPDFLLPEARPRAWPRALTAAPAVAGGTTYVPRPSPGIPTAILAM